jgi:hypothetical protein
VPFESQNNERQFAIRNQKAGTEKKITLILRPLASKHDYFSSNVNITYLIVSCISSIGLVSAVNRAD